MRRVVILGRGESWIMDGDLGPYDEIGYRRKSLPLILREIGEHAGSADVFMLTGPRAVRGFLAEVSHGGR